VQLLVSPEHPLALMPYIMVVRDRNATCITVPIIYLNINRPITRPDT